MSAARSFECSACNRQVDERASVCSGCQRELYFCSICRDVGVAEPFETTPLGSQVEKIVARVSRDRLKCGRCGRAGVRCRTRHLGGECNGLARADRAIPDQLCVRCSGRIWDLSKQAASFALFAFIGSRIRR